MRLQELVEKKKGPAGTYAEYKFAPESIKALRKWAKDNKIPERVPSEKMHCTLLYSKKYLPDYEGLGKLDPPIEVKPKRLSIFKSQTEGRNVLVVELDAPEFAAREKELRKEHGATSDFPTYKPHITLSYDFGDEMDIKDLPDISKDVPVLKAVEEIGRELVDDWTSK